MSIVAEQFTFVIGVDTHAATHSFALINATNGGNLAEAVFPNSPAGLDRACAWITRGIDENSALVVIEGAGSFGAGLAERVTNSGLPIAEPAVMPAAQRRGVGKTDALDAVRIARSVLAVDAEAAGEVARRPQARAPVADKDDLRRLERCSLQNAGQLHEHADVTSLGGGSVRFPECGAAAQVKRSRSA